MIDGADHLVATGRKHIIGQHAPRRSTSKSVRTQDQETAARQSRCVDAEPLGVFVFEVNNVTCAAVARDVLATVCVVRRTLVAHRIDCHGGCC